MLSIKYAIWDTFAHPKLHGKENMDRDLNIFLLYMIKDCHLSLVCISTFNEGHYTNCILRCYVAFHLSNLINIIMLKEKQ